MKADYLICITQEVSKQFHLHNVRSFEIISFTLRNKFRNNFIQNWFQYLPGELKQISSNLKQLQENFEIFLKFA